MRLISVEKCQLGMQVAQPIRNQNGQVLIQRNVILTERLIHRLQELDVQYVYIQDERTNDIFVNDALSPKTRSDAMETIKGTFTKIIKEGSASYMLDDPNLARNFKGVVKNILSDIRRQNHVMNMLAGVQATDNYTFQHSLNVTLYTLALASTLGYTERQLIEIGVGAILHDVGKCTIPLSILNKNGKLTDEEFAVIQEHTTNGFNMLRKITEISLLSAHCAYQHHERLDGSGYPRGLTGEEIHEYAKIIAIADVYDALTTHRSYRKPALPHVALEMITSDAGRLFDEKMVEAFTQSIAFYPLGMGVRLSTGEFGIIVDQNKNQPGRPIVRILEDDSGQELEEFKEVDLSKHPAIFIEECEI